MREDGMAIETHETFRKTNVELWGEAWARLQSGPKSEKIGRDDYLDECCCG